MLLKLPVSICDFSRPHLFSLQSLYVASICQLRRLESARHSFVCSHVAETFQGSVVVRAFQAQCRFVAQNDTHVDESQRVNFPRLVADRYEEPWGREGPVLQTHLCPQRVRPSVLLCSQRDHVACPRSHSQG